MARLLRLTRLALIAAVCCAAADRVVAADPPRHIASFNVCADQLAVALAAPDQIIGLSPRATDPTLSVVAEQARAFRRIEWQAEAVIPLNPDLVLTGPSYRLTTQPILRALGIRVVEVDLIYDLAGGREQIRKLAELFGHPERGEALLAELDAAQRRLVAAAARRPRATALLVANGGYTVGPASLAAELMGEAGLVSPPGAPSGFGGIVPLERLVALRPDYLVMSNMLEEPDGQGAVYLTHPALRELYPTTRRIILPARYTQCGGPSLPAALDYLTEIVSRLPAMP
jgi:iron complex transport system substrate-binding protein